MSKYVEEYEPLKENEIVTFTRVISYRMVRPQLRLHGAQLERILPKRDAD